MKDGKKKGLGLMIALGPPGKEEGGEADEGKRMAAESILDAVADRDPDALSAALQNHYDMCQGEEYGEDEEME